MAAPGFQLADDAARRYERWVAAFMTPMAEALLEVAEPADGSRVLDVACGTGFVTRMLPARVGTGGAVTGADVNPAMLRIAAAVCPPSICWIHAPADRLPLPDSEFDLVLCQQGVQFFPDPTAGFVEMRRVLRPGGRVAATVWNGPDDNPFLAAQTAGIEAALGHEAAEALRRVAGGGSDRLLASAAAAAGFGEIVVRRSTRTVEFPAAAEYLREQIMATPWGAQMAAAGPDAARAFEHTALAALQPSLRPDGSAVLPFTANLLLAQRPD